VLYHLVQDHLATLIEQVREADVAGYGLPRYVERELEDYLRCGILAEGFARVRCQACRGELLVAFSCKRRGIRPSCTGRRMADTAAHLVDRVLPVAPYRQWVLSLPRSLRLRLARDPAWVSFVNDVLVRAIAAWQRKKARTQGFKDSACGAVTFVQRFGGLINLNVHFHVVVPDGVFVTSEAEGAPLRFESGDRLPTDEDYLDL
jgi:hypothetical protein